MRGMHGRRSLAVCLLLAAGLLGGTRAAAGTTPTLGFADGSDVTVTAPGGTATTVLLNVALTGTDAAATGTTTVAWTATDTTGSGNTSGTLAFPLNADATKQISLSVKGLAGGTITVKLTFDDAVAHGDDTAVVTVAPAPSVSVADTTIVADPSRATIDATLPVTLSAPAADDVKVAFTAVDGTAKSRVDYWVATSSPLTIPKGKTTAPIALTIYGATKGGVSFTLTLTNVPSGNATLGNVKSTVTIAVPQVAVQDATFTRPGQDALVNVPVTLTPAAAGQVTVDYTYQEVTADYASDFEFVDTRLAIPAGQTSAGIPVSLLATTSVTEPVTFKIVITAVSTNARISRTTATITINPSAASLPTVSIAPVSIAAGTADKAASIPVSLSTATTSDVTVAYHASDGTAVSGTDYTLPDGTLTISAGKTSANVPVTIKGGSRGGMFTVTLSKPSSNAKLGVAAATITITSTAASTPVLSIADATFPVQGSPAALTVTLSAQASAPVTVDYTAADGTAKSGTDYVLSNGTLTIDPGKLTGSIAFTVPVGSHGGTFTVALAHPSGATIDPAAGSATVTLVTGAALSIADMKVKENVAGAKATLTVTLVGAPSAAVTVDYATSDGTAVAGTDYTTTSGTLTFATGTTTRTIDVPIIDNTAVNLDKTFVVTLSHPVNAILARAQATVTIVDDESSQGASTGSGGVDWGSQGAHGGAGSQHGSGAGTDTSFSPPAGGSSGGGSSGGAASGGNTGGGSTGGSVTVGTGSGTSAAAHVSVVAVSRSVAANRLLRLKVACPKAALADCAGSIAVATVKTRTQKATPLGSAKLSLKRGATATVTIRLVPLVTTLLARAKTVRTTLTVSVTAAGETSTSARSLVLQRPAAKPKTSVTVTGP